MKKSVIYIVISAFLFLFTSCGMSPDDMIEEFNKNVYKDVGGGDYIIENGKPSVSTSLIELPTYGVSIDGRLRINVSRDFIDYKWTFVDGNIDKEFSISGRDALFIYPSVLNLKVGGDYSVKLVVTNVDGALFTDSAKIIVTKSNNKNE